MMLCEVGGNMYFNNEPYFTTGIDVISFPILLVKRIACDFILSYS
jgi:hypothetical protein